MRSCPLAILFHPQRASSSNGSNGFRDATALETSMAPDWPIQRLPATVYALLEPRPIDRGKLDSRACWMTGQPLLQCSHNLKAVENRRRARSAR
jgi:hypothetical protein